jgi:hypothetical protein
MSGDLLLEIQRLQFTDRRAAETLLVPFLRGIFPLDVVDVTLRPLAVSLNSFNGFARLADGTALFFKTHIETDNVIDEFYNADLLARAGYRVLQPLHVSRGAGRQILIYPIMECPSVFDTAWAIDTGEMPYDTHLEQAQARTDRRLLEIYKSSLEHHAAGEAASAPVHQLFYHRLTGGRFDRFYGDDAVIHWNGAPVTMREVRSAHWEINGRRYTDTLDDLVKRAVVLLDPHQAGTAVIGHGDAHNGNLFYCADVDELIYFDPAFAGMHHPLLDLTKPLFHNVFAMWMYHPEWFDARLRVTLHRESGRWIVEHDHTLTPVRSMFLESKLVHVLMPLIQLLRQKGALHADWKAYLKSALMCCPLLTMNLADAGRFPEKIALLGLCYAMEMGGSADGMLNPIDAALLRVEQESG